MNILADTNVWIAFFRDTPGARGFEGLLSTHTIILHPWVYGELVLGSLSHSEEKVLSEMLRITSLPVTETPELLSFLRDSRLQRSGLGLVDAELMCSCAMNGHKLWSNDRQLRREATRFGLEYC